MWKDERIECILLKKLTQQYKQVTCALVSHLTYPGDNFLVDLIHDGFLRPSSDSQSMAASLQPEHLSGSFHVLHHLVEKVLRTDNIKTGAAQKKKKRA